jgi:hypothetical protein
MRRSTARRGHQARCAGGRARGSWSGEAAAANLKARPEVRMSQHDMGDLMLDAMAARSRRKVCARHRWNTRATPATPIGPQASSPRARCLTTGCSTRQCSWGCRQRSWCGGSKVRAELGKELDQTAEQVALGARREQAHEHEHGHEREGGSSAFAFDGAQGGAGTAVSRRSSAGRRQGRGVEGGGGAAVSEKPSVVLRCGRETPQQKSSGSHRDCCFLRRYPLLVCLRNIVYGNSYAAFKVCFLMAPYVTFPPSACPPVCTSWHGFPVLDAQPAHASSLPPPQVSMRSMVLPPAAVSHYLLLIAANSDEQKKVAPVPGIE